MSHDNALINFVYSGLHQSLEPRIARPVYESNVNTHLDSATRDHTMASYCLGESAPIHQIVKEWPPVFGTGPCRTGLPRWPGRFAAYSTN